MFKQTICMYYDNKALEKSTKGISSFIIFTLFFVSGENSDSNHFGNEKPTLSTYWIKKVWTICFFWNHKWRLDCVIKLSTLICVQRRHLLWIKSLIICVSITSYLFLKFIYVYISRSLSYVMLLETKLISAAFESFFSLSNACQIDISLLGWFILILLFKIMFF